MECIPSSIRKHNRAPIYYASTSSCYNFTLKFVPANMLLNTKKWLTFFKCGIIITTWYNLNHRGGRGKENPDAIKRGKLQKQEEGGRHVR